MSLCIDWTYWYFDWNVGIECPKTNYNFAFCCHCRQKSIDGFDSSWDWLFDKPASCCSLWVFALIGLIGFLLKCVTFLSTDLFNFVWMILQTLMNWRVRFQLRLVVWQAWLIFIYVSFSQPQLISILIERCDFFIHWRF